MYEISFPCDILWTSFFNIWNFVSDLDQSKLAQIQCWEGVKSWLDFGDLGQIFKVTATFFNIWNFVSVRYLMEPVDRFRPNLHRYNLWEGVKSWLDFGDLDLIFKVTATFCNVWNFVSGCYLLNQWTYFDQTCIDTLLGGCEELIRFWWPWLNFQGHSDLF